MSSNIKVQRICQYCGKEFTARTTVTKYCSHRCAGLAYKAKKRDEKVQTSNNETSLKILQPINDLKAKEFLSVNEVCKLIGISRRTIYRLFERGELTKIKIGSRTLIKRSALNILIDSKETGEPEIPEQQIKELNTWKQAGAYDIKDCYTLTEIQNKYGISDRALHEIIKRNSIPKIKKGWYAYVPKQIIDQVLK